MVRATILTHIHMYILLLLMKYSCNFLHHLIHLWNKGETQLDEIQTLWWNMTYFTMKASNCYMYVHTNVKQPELRPLLQPTECWICHSPRRRTDQWTTTILYEMRTIFQALPHGFKNSCPDSKPKNLFNYLAITSLKDSYRRHVFSTPVLSHLQYLVGTMMITRFCTAENKRK